MASNKGGGPGTSERGGVRSTMDNCNDVSTEKRSSGMGAPFGKAHDLGGGGIPVTMYDKSMKTPKLPSPGQGQGNSPILGGEGGQQRPGTK